MRHELEQTSERLRDALRAGVRAGMSKRESQHRTRIARRSRLLRAVNRLEVSPRGARERTLAESRRERRLREDVVRELGALRLERDADGERAATGGVPGRVRAAQPGDVAFSRVSLEGGDGRLVADGEDGARLDDAFAHGALDDDAIGVELARSK